MIAVAVIAFFVIKTEQSEADKKVAQKVDDLYWPLIIKHAHDLDLPAATIAAIICVESAGNPKAIGLAGEIGLMQLMQPALLDVVAKWHGRQEVEYYKKYLDVKKLLPSQSQLEDPNTNILYGATYLRVLVDRNKGDLEQAIQDFNDGSLNLGFGYRDRVKSFEQYFI